MASLELKEPRNKQKLHKDKEEKDMGLTLFLSGLDMA